MGVNKYIESITEIEVAKSGFKVRVWREELDYDNTVANQTFQELNDALVTNINSRIVWDRKAIADILFAVDRVNAVEVKDHGDGVVLYKDWP